MTLLIAVDPGRSSGLAAFREDRVEYVARVKSESIDPWPKVEALKSALHALGVVTTEGGRTGEDVHFVTEGQFLGRDVRAMVDVTRSATCWETSAALLGLKVEKREHPSTWQAAYGWQGRGRKPKWRREQMGRLTAEMYGRSMSPHESQIDVQCAALLGTVTLMRLAGWEGDLDTPHGGFEWVCAERNTHQERRQTA